MIAIDETYNQRVIEVGQSITGIKLISVTLTNRDIARIVRDDTGRDWFIEQLCTRFPPVQES